MLMPATGMLLACRLMSLRAKVGSVCLSVCLSVCRFVCMYDCTYAYHCINCMAAWQSTSLWHRSKDIVHRNALASKICFTVAV